MRPVPAFLQSLTRWAERRPDIEAAALVGSWARGMARPDSDVDIVMVVADPIVYLRDDAWVRHFGPVDRLVREDWGLV